MEERNEPIEDLTAASVEQLRAALHRGAAPLDAAAELARRGDPEGARALAAAVAFADLAQVAALAGSEDPVVSDALAAGVLGAGLPSALREACAAALETAVATPAALAALGEVADGPKRPPWSHASRALTSAVARSGAAARAEADRIRGAARQVRAGEGGSGRRLSFQREVARGTLHPIVGALLDLDFLGGVVPPVADDVAPALVPVALVGARAATEAQRAKVLALIQRRWGAVAGLAVSCAVRTPGRPKDDPLRVALVASLAAMGAQDALAACAEAGAGASRAAARAELAGARR